MENNTIADSQFWHLETSAFVWQLNAEDKAQLDRIEAMLSAILHSSPVKARLEYVESQVRPDDGIAVD